MNSRESSRAPSYSDPLLSSLLELGRVEERIDLPDHLLEELTREGASDLFERAARQLFPERRRPIEELLSQSHSLEDLEALRQRAKEGMKVDEYAGRVEACLLLFVTIAAALKQHQRLLGSLGGEALAAYFNDLAAVTMPPWADLFRAARVQLESGRYS